MNARDVNHVVNYLRQFFNGQLKCSECNELVAFSVDQLTSHMKSCSKRSTEILLHSVGSEIYEKFLKYSNVSNSMGTNASPTNFNTGSMVNADELNKFNVSVSSFQCLYCQSSGVISECERHLLECCDATESPLSCLCLLCEALIHGDQKTVVDHAHFKQDANFFSLNHYAHLAAILKNKVTNYYIFDRQILRTNLTMGFYCVVCDCYLFEGVDEHFNCADHKLRSDFNCELYYCEPCFVIIYGDARLFHHHTLSKNHVIMKSKTETRGPFKVENPIHKFLLMSVKAVLEKDITSHSDCSSYYCDLCFFVTIRSDVWLEHLACEEHGTKVCNGTVRIFNDEMKPFLFVCAFCKVSIYGTIFAHIMHCTSFGHGSVKNFLADFQNKANIAAIQQTETLRGFLISSEPAANKSGKNASSVQRCKNFATTTAFDRKATPVEAIVSDSSARFIFVKNLDTADILKMVENLRSFLLNAWRKCNVQQCKTQCWYCNDFSSNDSNWWAHLSSQPHIDRMNQHCRTNKSCKAIILFCCCCNLCVLGPPSIEKSHPTKAQHLKNTENFATHLRTTVATSVVSQRSARTSEPSSDVEGKSKQFDAAAVNIFEAVSGASTFNDKITSQFSKISVANEESLHELKAAAARANELGLCRTQSMSSNASSKCDNEDKSEDEGDVVSYVLLNGEDEDCEEKISDHELDDSFLNEMKNDLPGQSSTSSKSNEAILSRHCDTVAINDGNMEVVKHLIIAKGIPPQIIKNKRICNDTFSKYGVIRRMFTKKNRPDWLYLMVSTEPDEVFNRLHQNIKILKEKLGTDELSIEYDTRNTDLTGIRKQLSNEVKEIFSDLNLLNEAVLNLERLYEEECNCEESKMKMKHLENTILYLAQTIYGSSIPVKVFTFGSRVTGLATKNSDVDIYLQIDRSFGGGVHDNVPLQQQLVLLFSNKMRMCHSDFKNIVSIPFARVPIVKFTHARSNLNCDLSFKSGLSTMNSLLVKTYLKLDDRIKYLVCAVKVWTKKNDLADRNLFTTYAQIWMVLFFLMLPENAVVPTVLALRNTLPRSQQNVNVEGWNCAFPKSKNIVWRSKCLLTKEQLLFKFFQFYSQENLQDYVMCTLTGIKMEKKHFLESFRLLPSSFDEYKFKLGRDRDLFYKISVDFEGLCIQDPFDHCHNLTKTIGLRKFPSFINLCRQTVEIMKRNFSFG